MASRMGMVVKSKIINWLVPGIMVVVLPGCMAGGGAQGEGSSSYSSSRPDWVLNPPVGKLQFYGVGAHEYYGDSEAQSLTQAKAKARFELAQSVKVIVAGVVQSDIQVSNNDVTRNLRNTIRNRVPPMQFDKIEILKTYLDEEKKTTYALAHLDGNKAAERLRRQINHIDAQLAKFSTVEANLPILDQLRLLLPAMELIEKALQYHLRLEVFSGVPGDTSPYRQLSGRIGQLLDQLNIRIVSEGTGDKEIQGALEEHLSEKGIKVGSHLSPDIVIVYDVQLSDVFKSDELYYVIASSRITMKDNQGRTLGSFRTEAKGGTGLGGNRARTEAIVRVASQMGDQLADVLMTKLK